MRILCVLLVVAFVTVVRPASAQTTRPAGELAKENAELKKRLEKLEAYAAELEAKLRTSKPSPARPPSVRVVPRVPAPYGYQLPAPPFKLPSPPIVPAPKATPLPPDQVVPNLPQQSTPDRWKRHEFNGQPYFVVPLE